MDGTSFRDTLLALRDELQALGEAQLGSLNTRPKKLIHVSAMRLLEWPFGQLAANETAHVQRTIDKWAASLAQHRLPATILQW